ncbi:MAG: segregation/condensation protein A [Polyangia bacterium]
MNDTRQTPSDERYLVSLDVFEGPLDLLLHLIRKHEIDIYDIPIAFITEKYLEYLGSMQELNLDLAAEYLEMAATLAYIKSRTMVPADESDQEETAELEEGPDPREELVRQLLEYQKYREAADGLAGLPLKGRDTFARGATEKTEEPGLEAPSLFSLLESLKQVFDRVGRDPSTEISVTRMTVSARVQQLVDRMQDRSRCPFLELFDGDYTRTDVVVTFLAILEMTRLTLLRIHQAGPMAEIHVTLLADADESSRVISESKLEVEDE